VIWINFILKRYCEQNAEIFQLLSRKDLAEFAGIYTESTVKLIKAFERDGLIKLHEKDIILVNSEALMEKVKGGNKLV